MSVSIRIFNYRIKQQLERDGLILNILSPILGIGINELKAARELYSTNFALQASNPTYHKSLLSDYNTARSIFNSFGVCIESEHYADLVTKINATTYPIESEALVVETPLTPLQAFVFQYRPALDVRVLSESELATLAAEISAELTAQPE